MTNTSGLSVSNPAGLRTTFKPSNSTRVGAGWPPTEQEGAGNDTPASVPSPYFVQFFPQRSLWLASPSFFNFKHLVPYISVRTNKPALLPFHFYVSHDTNQDAYRLPWKRLLPGSARAQGASQSFHTPPPFIRRVLFSCQGECDLEWHLGVKRW